MGLAHSDPTLFAIAHKAAVNSHEDRSQSLVAIVFAAASVEGYVNGLLAQLDRHPEMCSEPVQPLAHLASTLSGQNVGLQLKLEAISAILQNRPVDWGSLVFQDLSLLLRLRNALLHLRPEEWPDSSEEEIVHGLVKQLEARVPSVRESSVRFSWLGCVHHPDVAEWAFRSSKTAAITIAEMFPAENERETLVKMARLLGEPITVDEAADWMLIPDPRQR